MFTQQEIKDLLIYNPSTGKLSYKDESLLNCQSKKSTTKHSGGYLTINIYGKYYLAHRIIFLYMKGRFPEQIDHINHQRDDNRWCNLREVINQENMMNTSLSKNSSTKVNGVSFHRQRNKYRAYIMVDRKQISLGLYTSIEDAKQARELANQKYNFHENHGKSLVM